MLPNPKALAQKPQSPPSTPPLSHHKAVQNTFTYLSSNLKQSTDNSNSNDRMLSLLLTQSIVKLNDGVVLEAFRERDYRGAGVLLEELLRLIQVCYCFILVQKQEYDNKISNITTTSSGKRYYFYALYIAHYNLAYLHQQYLFPNTSEKTICHNATRACKLLSKISK